MQPTISIPKHWDYPHFALDQRTRGESSEAAISRHATAENSTQREFHQIFSTFTREMRF
jgi:hypothetical protein